MRHFREHTRRFARRLFRGAREARLRDPLVHAWLLTGVFLLSGLLLRTPEKNGGAPAKHSFFVNSSGGGLIPRTAGPGTGWSDSFGGYFDENPAERPPVTLPSGEPGKPPEPVAEARVFEDFRAGMREAARRPWRFLSREIRETVNQTPAGRFSSLKLIALRSGAAEGGARLISWRGETGREPPDFIIGNGSHTADGMIETGPGWRDRLQTAPERLRVCFIGESGVALTPAQRAAAGELLNYLEIRLGTISWD